MDQQVVYVNPEEALQTTLTSEQLDQITTAILDGKYSWACILLLRFTQRNPLKYIPERTYYRLLIQNRISLDFHSQVVSG